MSTETHPPSPPPHPTGVHHHLSHRLSFRRLSRSRSQGSVTTESPQHPHRRSTSLQGLISRVMPSRREERGHTLRPDLQIEGSSHSDDLGAGFVPGLRLTHPSEKVKHDHDTLVTKVGVSSRSSRNRWGQSSGGDSAEATKANGHGRLSRFFGPPLKVVEKTKTKMAPRAEQRGESSQAYSLQTSSQHSAQAERHVVIVEPNEEPNPVMEEQGASKTQQVFEDEKESSKTQQVFGDEKESSKTQQVSEDEKESSKTQQVSEDEKETPKTQQVFVEKKESSKTRQMFKDKKGYPKTQQMFVEKKESSKTRQMFEDKKALREQRRALQESGDFLGVQGANPRTGYWDISDATSSTELSQTTDDEKNMLEVRARQTDDKRQFAKFEAAEAKHYTGRERVKSDGDLRKSERTERKELDAVLYQRRAPRWKAAENEWTSVTETALSPVEQSLAASPMRETASEDQIFPEVIAPLTIKKRMGTGKALNATILPVSGPTGKNPTHYVPQTPTKPRDYFSGLPATFSPFVCERSSSKTVEHAYKTSPKITISRKPVGSGDSRQKGNKSDETVLHDITKHKPAEQTSIQKEDSFKLLHDITKYPAADNQLHDNKHVEKSQPSETPKLVTAPAGASGCLSEQTSGQEPDSFLDHSHVENKVTANSSLSVSTKQVEVRQPLVQNQQSSNQGKRIIPLNLPPVYFKDPAAARMPQKSQPLSHPHPGVWAPPTIIDTEPDIFLSSTNTCTITTTGGIQKYHIPCQSHGPGETINDPTRHSPLRRTQSNIPLRTMYHLGTNTPQNNKLGSGFPTTPADIVISSEHKLDQTKQRTLNLCHLTSPEGERVEIQNIPTSISTSPLSPAKQRGAAARNAARERIAAARATPLATARSVSWQKKNATVAPNAAQATSLATRSCPCKQKQDEAVALNISRELIAAQALPPRRPEVPAKRS
ncbi:hypothetical protein LOCC1_G001522 [Lachnellula occidentalis]|uniref:Uncharacterized protein n=1 Tax=Lachnellula occidentalis TaxID=215460 RepID=A0A8H8UH77_9HELO|nr:hypothetical protein LOCC1_G001522 [Lachnellula occidentalis]